MTETPYDAVIIGGGFFGCRIALHLRDRAERILILEKERDLLQRASYTNQARVHNGYHYPRSLLTALRSRVNFPNFVREYADCIDTSFRHYYAIARKFSKVSAPQYLLFCRRIGADIRPAPDHVRSLFNDDLIEDVFEVQEYVFDATRMKEKLIAELLQSGIDWQTGATVERITPAGRHVAVTYQSAREGPVTILAGSVYNCTYAHLNTIHRASGLPIIPLKHELAELALVDVPSPLQSLAITVVDGPFFSLMPFPPKRLHTLSHVRYTPHAEWFDSAGNEKVDSPHLQGQQPKSNAPGMLADARRFLPLLTQAHHIDSLWEIKTLLPKSEADDSRPILLREHHGVQNYTCVLGGKIDNVYDCVAELSGSRVTARA